MICLRFCFFVVESGFALKCCVVLPWVYWLRLPMTSGVIRLSLGSLHVFCIEWGLESEGGVLNWGLFLGFITNACFQWDVPNHFLSFRSNILTPCANRYWSDTDPIPIQFSVVVLWLSGDYRPSLSAPPMVSPPMTTVFIYCRESYFCYAILWPFHNTYLSL